MARMKEIQVPVLIDDIVYVIKNVTEGIIEKCKITSINIKKVTILVDGVAKPTIVKEFWYSQETVASEWFFREESFRKTVFTNLKDAEFALADMQYEMKLKGKK